MKTASRNSNFVPKMRYFVDGCFDSLHYAHINLLYQAKQLCDYLVVGTHSDDEMNIHKNIPLNTFEDRKFMLKFCKFVDYVIEEPVDYITNEKTLIKYNCEKFVHGYEHVLTKNNVDALKDIKDSGKYVPVPSTIGISTTNLIYRLKCQMDNKKFNTCNDTVYLKNILNKVKSVDKQINMCKCIYIINDFDMFNRKHIEYIQKYLYNDVDIIAVIKRDDNVKYIYNELETSIILNSINIIDKVIYYEEMEKELTKCSVIKKESIIYEYPDFTKFQKKIDKETLKIEKNDKLKKEYIDTNIYYNVLKSQFNTLNEIIKNTEFSNDDIIVFDIDEVVLSNLPYTNNYTFLSNKENIESGYCLLIEECVEVFKTIHDRNINYAYITGRKNYLKEITIKNLDDYKMNKYKYLFLCPDNYIEEIQDYKTDCRVEISKKYNIKYNIGDQLTDLIGNVAENEYLIFNPFYKTV